MKSSATSPTSTTAASHRFTLQRKVLEETEKRQRGRREEEQEKARTLLTASLEEKKAAVATGTRTPTTTALPKGAVAGKAMGSGTEEEADKRSSSSSSSLQRRTTAARPGGLSPSTISVNVRHTAGLAEAVKKKESSGGGGGGVPDVPHGVAKTPASPLTGNIQEKAKLRAKIVPPTPPPAPSPGSSVSRSGTPTTTTPSSTGSTTTVGSGTASSGYSKVVRTPTPARRTPLRLETPSTTTPPPSTAKRDGAAALSKTTRSTAGCSPCKEGGRGGAGAGGDVMEAKGLREEYGSITTTTTGSSSSSRNVPPTAGLSVLSLYQANTVLQQELQRVQLELEAAQGEVREEKRAHQATRQRMESQTSELRQKHREQQERLREQEFAMERLQQRESRRSATPSSSASTAHRDHQGQGGGGKVEELLKELAAKAKEVEVAEERRLSAEETVRRLTDKLRNDTSELRAELEAREEDARAAERELRRLEEVMKTQREHCDAVVKNLEERLRQATTPPPLLLRTPRAPRVTFQLPPDAAAAEMQADLSRMRKEYDVMEWHTVWLEKETQSLREKMISASGEQSKLALGAGAGKSEDNPNNNNNNNNNDTATTTTTTTTSNHHNAIHVAALEATKQELAAKVRELEVVRKQCREAETLLDTTAAKMEKMMRSSKEKDEKMAAAEKKFAEELASERKKAQEALRSSSASSESSQQRVAERRIRREVEKELKEAYELERKRAEAEHQTALESLRSAHKAQLEEVEAKREEERKALTQTSQTQWLAEKAKLTAACDAEREKVQTLSKELEAARRLHRDRENEQKTKLSSERAALQAEIKQLQEKVAATATSTATKEREWEAAVAEGRRTIAQLEATVKAKETRLSVLTRDVGTQKKLREEAEATAAQRAEEYEGRLLPLQEMVQRLERELDEARSTQQQATTPPITTKPEAAESDRREDIMELEEALCAMGAEVDRWKDAARKALSEKQASEEAFEREKAAQEAELGVLRRVREKYVEERVRVGELEEALCTLQQETEAREARIKEMEEEMEAKQQQRQRHTRCLSSLRLDPAEVEVETDLMSVRSGQRTPEPRARSPTTTAPAGSGRRGGGGDVVLFTSASPPANATILATPRKQDGAAALSPSRSPSRAGGTSRRARSLAEPHRLDSRFFDPTAHATQQVAEVAMRDGGDAAAETLLNQSSISACSFSAATSLSTGGLTAWQQQQQQQPHEQRSLPLELLQCLHGSPSDLTFLQIGARFLLLGRGGKRIERPSVAAPLRPGGAVGSPAASPSSPAWKLQRPPEHAPSPSPSDGGAGRASSSALGSISHVVWATRMQQQQQQVSGGGTLPSPSSSSFSSWHQVLQAIQSGTPSAPAEATVFVFAVRVSWLPAVAVGGESMIISGEEEDARAEVLIGFAERGLPLERYASTPVLAPPASPLSPSSSSSSSLYGPLSGSTPLTYFEGRWRPTAEVEAEKLRRAAPPASPSTTAGQQGAGWTESSCAKTWNSRRVVAGGGGGGGGVAAAGQDASCYYYNIANAALYSPIQNIREVPIISAETTTTTTTRRRAKKRESVVVQCALHLRESCITFSVYEEEKEEEEADEEGCSRGGSPSTSMEGSWFPSSSRASRWVERCRDVVGFSSVDVSKPLFPAVEVNGDGVVVDII